METLPNDVLVDILSRLQVRHLCQLKCVSKQWHKLISDPYLKKLHSTRWMRNPRLLMVKESIVGHPALFGQPLSRTLYISTMDISTGEIFKEFTKDIIGRYYCYILGNNLICFETYMALVVCNPTTREIVHLPLPSQPSISYNLGYHKGNNEYKIIHLFRHPKHDNLGFETITLKDGGPVPKAWTKVQNHTTYIWNNYHNQIDSISIDGAIYWLVHADGNGKRIICFDLKNEHFTSTCCPQDYTEISHGRGDNEQLVDIEGFLCLAHCSKQFSTVTIFMLKDHANQMWVKEYTIDLCHIRHGFRIIGYISIDDDQNGEFIIKPLTGRPLLYNIKNRSLRKIGQRGSWIGWYKNLYFDRFFFLGNR